MKTAVKWKLYNWFNSGTVSGIWFISTCCIRVLFRIFVVRWM